MELPGSTARINGVGVASVTSLAKVGCEVAVASLMLYGHLFVNGHRGLVAGSSKLL